MFFFLGRFYVPSQCSSLGLTLANCLEEDFPMFLLVPAPDSPSSTRLMSSGATCVLLLAPRDQTGWLKLRYESFTLILYKGLSSSIFQSLSLSESVSQSVSPCLAYKVPKPQPTPPRNTPRSFLQAYISWMDSAHK